MKANSIYPETKISNLNYWKNKIPGNIQPTNLRLDFQRPVDYRDNIGVLELKLDGELSQKIIGLANSESFLIYSILMAALNICLYKYVKAPVIIAGSPALKEEQGSSAGHPPLAIISEIGDHCSFKEFLLYTRNNLVESYEKQDYTYDELIKELGLDSKTNKCPIFDIALGLKNLHHDLPALKNDISISITLEPGNLCGSISFNEDLFYKGTIRQFLLHYSQVLSMVLEKPDILIAEVSLILEEEMQDLLFTWNNTDTDYPSDKCMHQLFEDFAEKTPGDTALVYGTKKLSYKDLNNQANQLAHHLQDSGIKPNSMVGLFIERSPEMIIVLLAVLKAGGAYVPLDTSYPPERIGTMLETGNFEIILTKVSLFNQLPKNDAKVICVDYDAEKIAAEKEENCENQPTVNDLCYVIFTSGSTGVPKGAAVSHKGWTNLLHWFITEFEINPRDRNLIISSFSFDLTQRAIAMSLITGGELHLLNSSYYDPDLITKTIDQEQITLMNCAPSTFYPLIENKDQQTLKKFSSLRVLFLGGEAISASRLKNWVETEHCNARIGNVYGAAECTDVSSFYVLTHYDQYIKSSVPAGKPIFNTQVYILDEELKLVPKGFVGEICIAGIGVGKGYINDEALTTEKFVQNPFNRGTNDTLYRTGDLGRFLPDGNIEFIGRVDQQIKIRGLRIDLGDIETAIRQNQHLKEGIVIVKNFSDNDQRLIAYIVKKEETDNLSDEDIINRVREFLNEKLPGYMVPSLFYVLGELPLTPNGKIDRNALPDPESSKDEAEDSENREVELLLLKVFAETLKIKKVDIDDNFFRIGGHSLLAAQVVSSVSQSLKIELAQVDLLANPTVRGFARRIQEISTSQG